MKSPYFLLFVAMLSYACKNEQVAKDPIAPKNDFYDKAYSLLDSNLQDSAFKYFSFAKNEFASRGDNFRVGNCLLNMSIIASNFNDFFGSIELSLEAIPYLHPDSVRHRDYIHRNYNSIGFSNFRLRNYNEALKYYALALKFSTDSSSTYLYRNNEAKVFEETKNYDAANQIYTSILKEVPNGTTMYAKALSNLATTKWAQNSRFNAAPDLLTALEIYKQQEDLWGQNYCLARLADFYTDKDAAKALAYAYKMYQVASVLNSPNDRLEALYKLVKLSPHIPSKQYFIAYEKLDDSLKFAAISAKNQFALIRYNTLKLEKENTEKKHQITWQRTIMYGFFILAAVAAIALVFWYKKRKQRLLQEKELEVKNTELKYVKKVHDRVANRLYNIMMEVENGEALAKTVLADKLEVIYNISRDISYEHSDLDRERSYAKQISELLQAYASNAVAIKIEGNNEAIWENVVEHKKSEVATILLELMTNMTKHSQATEVEIVFERRYERVNICYRDNGIGIAGAIIYKNGLTNTGNRITQINGTINFETEFSKGLRVNISFPVI